MGLNDPYNPSSKEPPSTLRVSGPSTISGRCPDPIAVPEGTPPQDVITLHGLVSWARSKILPEVFIEKIPRLATRDVNVVREIADELVDLGYPYTAYEWRSYWRARPTC